MNVDTKQHGVDNQTMQDAEAERQNNRLIRDTVRGLKYTLHENGVRGVIALLHEARAFAPLMKWYKESPRP